MSEWSGFTDADLKRMRQMSDSTSHGNSTGPKIVKPVTGGRPKAGTNMGQRPQRKPNIKASKKSVSKEHGDVPASAMLSKNSTSHSTVKKNAGSPSTTPNEQIPLHGKTSPSPSIETQQAPSSDVSEVKEPEIVEDVEVIREKEKIKLEDIQRRQKEMEEKNKKRKSMLSKAIAERKKKAFAESTKLIRIQSELAKLDDMLNYDVSIVRDKIDAACQEYNTAQKRFERAEAEYIDAKLNLHRATEMKEDLTEHLYKLIQLNEERKANKLEDLMQKLDLEGDEDAEEAEQVEPSIPESSSLESEKKISEAEGTEANTAEQKDLSSDKTEEDSTNSQETVQ